MDDEYYTKAKELKNKYSDIGDRINLEDPMIIIESMAQGLSDAADTRGLAYLTGNIGINVLLWEAASKDLSKLGNKGGTGEGVVKEPKPGDPEFIGPLPAEGNAYKGTGGAKFGKAKSYGIDIENLQFSKKVQSHTGRPYQNSKSLINEIIESSPPKPDPQGTNALSWTVEGTYNGSKGIYELVIDPKTNTVWHFVFKSKK